MVETAKNETYAIRLLNFLLELEFNAIRAYERAISQIKRPELKEMLEDFLQDHRDHVEALSTTIDEIGGDPVVGAALKLLSYDETTNDDGAILKALRMNEEKINEAYEQANQNFSKSQFLDRLLVGHLHNGRRHCDWILAILQATWK